MEIEDLTNYLTFTVIGNRTGRLYSQIEFVYPKSMYQDIKYSKKRGDGEWESWRSVKGGADGIFAGDILNVERDYYNYLSIKLTKGDYVRFWNSTPNGSLPLIRDYGEERRIYFSMNSILCEDVESSGSILSLINFKDEMPSAGFRKLFYNCRALKTAPKLPITTLSSSCYQEMFMGCTSLTDAPELPASELAPSCYFGMFEGCTSLTGAPALLAEKLPLSSYCYSRMFYGCSSLSSVSIGLSEIPVEPVKTDNFGYLLTAPQLNQFQNWLTGTKEQGKLNRVNKYASFNRFMEKSGYPSGVITNGWEIVEENETPLTFVPQKDASSTDFQIDLYFYPSNYLGFFYRKCIKTIKSRKHHKL